MRHKDRVPLERLWGAPLSPESLSSSCFNARYSFNARLQMSSPWPVPLVWLCWGTVAGQALPVAVRGLCSEHKATWSRNTAPKCDRSNLEEVELQG